MAANKTPHQYIETDWFLKKKTEKIYKVFFSWKDYVNKKQKEINLKNFFHKTSF